MTIEQAQAFAKRRCRTARDALEQELFDTLAEVEAYDLASPLRD